MHREVSTARTGRDGLFLKRYCGAPTLGTRGRFRIQVATAIPAWILGAALLVWGAQAQALGLGPLQLRSALGEPLHMRVAVNAASIDEVGCVQVKPHGDGLPVLPPVRSQVISTDRGIFIEVTSALAMEDPALQLIVTAGCSGAVSREYVLLLDPPPLVPVTTPEPNAEAPRAALPATPVAAPKAPPPPRRAPVRPSTVARAKTGGIAEGTTGQPAPPPPSEGKAQPPARAPRRGPPAEAVAKPASPVASATVGKGDALRVTPPTPPTPVTSPNANASVQPATPEVAAAAAPTSPESPAAGSAGSPGATAESSAAAREQQLEKQLQTLSTEVEALRDQMRAVNARNRELESKNPTTLYTWLLALLAIIALALAAWLAWSYRSLQRKSAARPWFEQTQLGPIPTPPRPSQRRPASARDEGLDEPLRGTDGIEATEMLASDPFGGAAALVRPPVAPPSPPPPTVQPPSAPPLAPPVAAPLTSSSAGSNLRASGSGRVPSIIDAAAAARAEAAAIARQAASTSDVLPLVSAVRLERAGGDKAAAEKGDKSLTASGSGIAPLTPATPEPPKEKRELEPILDIDLTKTEPVSSLQDHSPDIATLLDFELPALNLTKTEDKGAPEVSGSHRMVDLKNTGGIDSGAGGSGATDSASVQFRLIQFASVVERAKEMQRAQDLPKAVALLREYVLRDDLSATMIWLMLFDLYRQLDKKPVYDALAENFQRRYKRSMVGWQEPLTLKTPQSPLALNQELDLRINALWGTQAGIELLRDLTCGVDQPDRIVFNAELQRDLLQLAKVFPLEDTQ
ncbi:MAG: hypothetical protein ABSF50_16120 [Burkholderiaceae bacterium]